MGSVAAGFKHIREGVVVLGHIFLPAHRAEVRDNETTLGLHLDNFALVLVGPSLIFALPHDRAARLPVGFHMRSEHVPLDLSRIGQCRPDACRRRLNVGLGGRDYPGHGSCSSPHLTATVRHGYGSTSVRRMTGLRWVTPGQIDPAM